MIIKECKNCGNSQNGYEIHRCGGCGKILGCYKQGFVTDNGCAKKLILSNKCPYCDYKGGWFSKWNEILATIG